MLEGALARWAPGGSGGLSLGCLRHLGHDRLGGRGDIGHHRLTAGIHGRCLVRAQLVLGSRSWGGGYRSGSYYGRPGYGYGRPGYYTGGRLWWGYSNPWLWGPGLGYGWYGSSIWWDSPRYYAWSRADASRMALPAGKLPPGGRTGGFLYFPRIDRPEGSPVYLQWVVRDSASQQTLGEVQLPLELSAE